MVGLLPLEEFPQNAFTEDRQVLVIAQELEAVYPELVITDANSYKTVDYPKLTAVLIEANKALNEQWEEKFSVQGSKIQKLEADLEAIKTMLNLADQAEN